MVDENDILKITGDYEVKDGASITIEDADGTQATFTGDVNAKITEVDGDIRNRGDETAGDRPQRRL